MLRSRKVFALAVVATMAALAAPSVTYAGDDSGDEEEVSLAQVPRASGSAGVRLTCGRVASMRADESHPNGGVGWYTAWYINYAICLSER
jgi:hypothetical protein